MSVATPMAMPNQRKPHDHGDKTLLATGAEISPGDHPFEVGEHLRASSLADDLLQGGVQAEALALARGTAFQLNDAIRNATRADDELPRQANQVPCRQTCPRARSFRSS